jgi:hypothetical protein
MDTLVPSVDNPDVVDLVADHGERRLSVKREKAAPRCLAGPIACLVERHVERSGTSAV